MDSSLNLSLRLMDDRSREERLQDLTYQLAADLRQQDGIKSAHPPSEGSKTGQRGDLIAIGTIIVQLAGSAAVASLVDVLRAYIDRKPTLEVELQKNDGASLKIRTEHLRPDHADELIRAVQEFLKG